MNVFKSQESIKPSQFLSILLNDENKSNSIFWANRYLYLSTASSPSAMAMKKSFSFFISE
jgi:hypothetical protein